MDDIRYVEEVYNSYITDYVVPFVFKNLDIISGNVPEDFDPGSREFRNITSGYYVLANQKMELILELDTVNNTLKNNILNSEY